MNPNHRGQHHDDIPEDAIDRAIQQRQALGDDLIDALIATVPRGDETRQAALEDDLVAQLRSQYSNEQSGKDDQTMQIVQHTPRTPTIHQPSGLVRYIPHVPATLAATMVAVILGAVVLAIGNSAIPPSADPSMGAGIGQDGNENPTLAPTSTPIDDLVNTVVNGTLDVLEQPTSDSDVVFTLGTGDEYVLVGSAYLGQWYFLGSDDTYGWVFSQDFFQAAGIGGHVPMPTTPPGEPTLVPTVAPDNAVLAEFSLDITESVDVFVIPFDDGEVVATIDADSSVDVIGWTGDLEWTYIGFGDDMVGWVALRAVGDTMIFDGVPGVLPTVPPSDGTLVITATPIGGATAFPPTALPPDNDVDVITATPISGVPTTPPEAYSETIVVPKALLIPLEGQPNELAVGDVIRLATRVQTIDGGTVDTVVVSRAVIAVDIDHAGEFGFSFSGEDLTLIRSLIGEGVALYYEVLDE